MINNIKKGSVQEEILFSIKPECLASILLCEKMADNETIVIKGMFLLFIIIITNVLIIIIIIIWNIIGAEQYSKHLSKHNQFVFESDYVDNTPMCVPFLIFILLSCIINFIFFTNYL